jgi:hypothetical protein
MFGSEKSILILGAVYIQTSSESVMLNVQAKYREIFDYLGPD